MTNAHTTGDNARAALKGDDDLRGVKRGSRWIPLLTIGVMVVIFAAFAIQRSVPEIALQSFAREADIPETGKNTVVVARVGQDQPDEVRKAFDSLRSCPRLAPWRFQLAYGWTRARRAWCER